MRLFALVADVNKDGFFENKRDIVMDYLNRQYSQELVQKYIEYFDSQIKLHHPELMYSSDDATARQKDSNEADVIEICNQMNEELEMEQKLIVLIYLLDFINRGEALTFKEQKFIFKVAINLKLSIDEFKDLRAFTFAETHKVINKYRLLFIDANDSSGDEEIKHMASPKMEGRITVLHLPSTNIYVFRYNGHMEYLLNGHSVKPNRSYIWSVGSVLKNSKAGSLYYTRMAGKFIQANIESKFVFTAHDIEFRYGNSNNGIRKFNLTEESGRFIGIIGGSGSGKSTLLNLLNGNLKPKSGQICINGYDIHKYKEELKGVIGYVPQDDLLIKELTVFQNLYYNAELSFSDYTEEQVTQLVERALIDFDLVEARDLSVGDAITTILSGGQRKRLNIALELIREPSILFADEPTSGLSSADSEKVINLLKRQTFKGNLVFANIHQPSSDIFKMFDKLLVMDQGGRIIYYGNPMDGLTYFKRISHFADAEEGECLSCGNINSEEILRTVEARVVDANGRLTRKRKILPQEWYDLYLKNIDVEIKQIHREHDNTIPKSLFKVPGHFKQFKIFLKRDVLAKLHNRQYMLLNALEAPVLALILAFFTKRFVFEDGIPRYIFGENPNIPAFIFMSVIVALFLGLVISAEEIFKDRTILKREKFLSLSRSSYLFSKIAILFSISAIQMLIFVLVGTHMLQIHDMVLRYWFVLFTASCWANLIGLNISAGLNSVVTIYILIPLILVPQLLFSGVVVDFDKMHNKIASDETVPVIGDLMTSRWAYEALMVTQFKDNRFEKEFYSSEKRLQIATYYKSFCIPKLQDITTELRILLMKPTDTLKILHYEKLISNGIFGICNDLNWQIPTFTDSIVSIKMDSNQIDKILTFFSLADRQFVNEYNNAIRLRDDKYEELVAKFGGRDKFLAYKDKHYNKQVGSVVTNEKEIMEFYIHNDEILPLKNAIYRVPGSKIGRSHYYAPVKKFFSFYVDTFWFNIVVIWLFGGLLLALLYYDILRKIIGYFEMLRIIRANRRRLLRLLNITDPDQVRKPQKST